MMKGIRIIDKRNVLCMYIHVTGKVRLDRLLGITERIWLADINSRTKMAILKHVRAFFKPDPEQLPDLN